MSEAEEEHESLRAIFGDEVIIDANTLCVRVRVSDDFHVVCPEDAALACTVPRRPIERSGRLRSFAVQCLPPLTLRCVCGDEYPASQPPQYTLTCPWLTRKQLSKLCQKLDAIWEENKGFLILFQWISFLQDESLEFLSIKSPFPLKISKPWKMPKKDSEGVENPSPAGDATEETTAHKEESELDPRAFQDANSVVDILKRVLEWDSAESKSKFEKEFHDCEICFTEKQGTQCVRFEVCKHIFCKTCVKSHLTSKIADGAVRDVTCPSIGCDASPLPTEIRSLVDKEMYDKYDRLLLQVTLDEMNDIVYCPRQACQFAVVVDAGSEMGFCNKCQYSFCVLCKHAWHGLNGCKIEDLGKLLTQYRSGDPHERALLERKYGKGFLERACAEAASHAYLKTHAQPCPSCGAHISKTEGCNKMVCTKCSTYFCWLCKAKLNTVDPYAHYALGNMCGGRLFDQTEIDRWEENEGDVLVLDDDFIEWERGWR